MVDLAKQVRDEEQQVFLLAGIITFADKIIDPEFAKQIEEWISMTKVARLYEEKRLAAVALVKEQMEKEKEEAVRQMKEEKEKKEETVRQLEEENQEAALKLTAMKWIIKGRTPQEAARESGLSIEEVEELLK